MKKEEGLCQYRRICPGSNVFTGKVNVEGSGLTVKVSLVNTKSGEGEKRKSGESK